MCTYPSKLLLFGEYAIINGGNGLALPLFLFKGQWSFHNKHSEIAEFSRKSLYSLYNYIASHEKLYELCKLESFNADLKNGIWLETNIPYGYGLGSSGSISAAVYDTYFEKAEDLNEIKNHLAIIESHFHGSSSGLDPIVSYTKSCITIDNKITKLINHYPTPNFKIHLLDTGLSRNSTPLIADYLKRTEDKHFKKALLNYTSYNDKCIKDFLTGNNISLQDNLYELSKWQLEHFYFLIPNDIKNHWQTALTQKDYIFKICGAGGGGYILLFEFEEKSIKTNLYNIYNIIQAL